MDAELFRSADRRPLLAGVMYSLVAIGFVLIYKVSGVFNFAQGAMVFFAGVLTYVSLIERGWPFWPAPRRGARAHDRARLRHRARRAAAARQPAADHAMVTIGLAYFLEGVAQGVWGAQGTRSRSASRTRPSPWPASASASSTCSPRAPAALWCWCSVFFQKTKTGRALRAAADDHQAALSVGIQLKYVWAIVWAAAGFVALVAGLLWGARTRRAVRYSPLRR